MIIETPLKRLNLFASKSLPLWNTPQDAEAKLINISENTTYLVEGTNWKSILRLHRENYHSKRAIECELAWSRSLSNDGVLHTPDFYLGRNGDPVQSVYARYSSIPHFMVMFHFIEGKQPKEDQDLVASFEQLGRIAAKTHLHSIKWIRPQPFERPKWNLESVFGGNPTWGNWRDAPNVTVTIRRLLEKVETTVSSRLSQFSMAADRYGLIHADMRLANVLIDQSNTTRLIDFDDCGIGWFLYDFAAGISFMEDHRQLSFLKESWIKGYRTIRDLPQEHIDELDTFIMLRRLVLLAWIGSHMESTEPQALAPNFASVSAELGEKYLLYNS